LVRTAKYDRSASPAALQGQKHHLPQDQIEGSRGPDAIFAPEGVPIISLFGRRQSPKNRPRAPTRRQLLFHHENWRPFQGGPGLPEIAKRATSLSLKEAAVGPPRAWEPQGDHKSWVPTSMILIVARRRRSWLRAPSGLRPTANPPVCASTARFLTHRMGTVGAQAAFRDTRANPRLVSDWRMVERLDVLPAGRETNTLCVSITSVASARTRRPPKVLAGAK